MEHQSMAFRNACAPAIILERPRPVFTFAPILLSAQSVFTIAANNAGTVTPAAAASSVKDLEDVRLRARSDDIARRRENYLNLRDPSFLTFGPKTRREFLNLKRWPFPLTLLLFSEAFRSLSAGERRASSYSSLRAGSRLSRFRGH